MQNINKLLKKQIELIKPDKPTFGYIKKTAEGFCEDLRKKLRKKKIKADVFIGGSLAKKTLVKKGTYDVDIFVRFDGKYGNDGISKLLGNVLGRNVKKVHGSRDYFQVVVNDIIIEIVPVLKINRSQQAENITDLSYFHINYILKKIRKNKDVAEGIILAKTFTYANNCYGAESYIHGFSGYGLELLICHYGSFLKFIKGVVNNGKEKIIIDDSKFYKNNMVVLRELNESKLDSPIVLIDPTFKERNALAGLSDESFLKFRKICLNFLRNPNSDFFEKRNVFEVLDKKYKNRLKIVSVKTNRQEGDIAGTKSRKFFKFFKWRLKREFEIKKAEFDYNENKNIAYFYLVVDKKKDEIVRGPHASKIRDFNRFKKVHSNAFIKNHFAYVNVKHELSFEEFFKMFKKKYKKVVKEMDVEEINLLD